MAASVQDKAGLELVADGNRLVCRLTGAWRGPDVTPLLKTYERDLQRLSRQPVVLDLSAITAVDVAGAWLIKKIETSLAPGSSLAGTSPRLAELLEALPATLPKPEPVIKPYEPFWVRMLAPVGSVMAETWHDLVAGMHILGSAVRGAQMKAGRGSGLSMAALVNQIDNMAVGAMPIILLMSFLIGAIIAQQGAFQLRYFGAEIFVVDLVGILQLREIGVLLTAIMIAGRSGSAITAEIGSMKMREEIDALMVMGLNPVGVLVFPRLAALALALPLLTIIANFAALAGAAVVALLYSGVTFEVFIARLHGAISYSTVIVGLVKAPFMALIIGVVAAVEGMKVGGSAESLGKQVTTAVVKSIFVVILVDGLFAMFFAKINF